MDNNDAYSILSSPGATLNFISPSQAYDETHDNAKCVVILKHLGTCNAPLSYLIKNSQPHLIKYMIRPQRGIVKEGNSATVNVILAESQKREMFGSGSSITSKTTIQARQEMADSISVEWSKPKNRFQTVKARQEMPDSVSVLKNEIFFSPLTRAQESSGIIDLVLGDTDAKPKSSSAAAATKVHFAFKIKVNQPHRYFVKPAFGVISPGSRKVVKLIMVNSMKESILDAYERSEKIPSCYQCDKVKIEFIAMNDSFAGNILEADGGSTSKNDLKQAFTEGWEDAIHCFQISQIKVSIQHTIASTSPQSPSIKYPALEIKLDSKRTHNKAFSKDQSVKKKGCEQREELPPELICANVVPVQIVTPIAVAEPVPLERPVIVVAEVVRGHDNDHNQIASSNASSEHRPTSTSTSTSRLKLPKGNTDPSSYTALLEKLGIYTIAFKLDSFKAWAVGLFLIVPVFGITWFGLNTFAMVHAIFFVPQWNSMKEQVREEAIAVTTTRVFLREIHSSSDSGNTSNGHTSNGHTSISYEYKYKYVYTDPENNENHRFQNTISSKSTLEQSFLDLVVLSRAPNMPYRSSQLKNKGRTERFLIFFAGFAVSSISICLYIIGNGIIEVPVPVNWIIASHVVGAILSPLVFVIQKQFFLCHWNVHVGHFIWDPCSVTEV